MAKTILKWSSGNTKLKKLKTVSFNLPAFRSADGFEVCPKAGGCATLCYARQGRYVMPQVARTRELNLWAARGNKEKLFFDLVSDLKAIPEKVIRVHDSGDFFDQAYLDTWIAVMYRFPEKKFYAYTKSLHLDFSQAPANFQVVQSVGGLLDAQINRKRSHSRIFATHADRRKAGYVDGNKDDGPAIRGERKIGLVYHGQKTLKPGQVTWLKML